MNHTEHTAQTQFLRTGIFATLGGLLPAEGKGAPSSSRLALPLVLLTCLFALAFTAAPASAGLIHPYKAQLTGTPGGAFSYPLGIAVDPATQDLYVVETGGNRVDIFNSAGVYQSQITAANVPTGSNFHFTVVAVSDTTGDLYVGAGGEGPSTVYVFNTQGVYQATMTGSDTPAGGFRFVEGIAVDQSSGDVYVADGTVYEGDLGHNVVDRFNSANEYQSQLTFPGRPSGVTVDPSGDLYVTGFGGTEEFNSTGTQILHISVSGDAVAVDSAGNIYVGVAEFDPSGALVNEMHTFVRSASAPSAHFGQIAGVAVNSTGDMYVSDPTHGVVDVFGPNVLVPEISSEAATGVSDHVATLHGMVNPEGTEVTSCEFQYRTVAEPEYGQRSINCTPNTPYTGSADVAVEAELGGLLANTTYYYRLLASNASGAEGGPGYGPEESFKTPGSPRIEAVSAEVPLEKAGQTHATLNAQIDPDGRETTYTFEYGETESYGTSLPFPPAAIGSGEAFVPVSAELSGLNIGTTYHYRVSASNEFGTVPSADQTFSTLPPALIQSESASAVAATSATLEAQIDPLGASSTCQFQYVTDAGFQATGYATATTEPCLASLGEGEVGVPTSIHLQNLTAHTTYHYRVLGTNQLGITEGTDRTFTTQPSIAGPTLPDGRAWEMVSPPDKHGALLAGLPVFAALQASVDGDAFSYFAAGATESEAAAEAGGAQVLSSRGPSGWSSEDIATPHLRSIGASGRGTGEFDLFSADLSRGLVEPSDSFKRFSPPTVCTAAGCLPAAFPEATEFTPYIRHNATCATQIATCYEPLLTAAPGYADVPPGTEFGEPFPANAHGEFTGAAPNLYSVVLSSEARLTPGAPHRDELYEWSAAFPPTERLQLISVLPQSEGGGPFTGPQSETVTLGALSNRPAAGGWRPVSADGSRVFWAAGNANSGRGALYMFDAAANEGEGETLRLDSGGGATFQAASSDGSRVFFTEAGHLYVCEIVEQAGRDACNSTDLTPEANGESPGVRELIQGTSADGSSAYFVATSVQTSVPNSRGEAATSGQSNLYLSHFDGAHWATTFIATLSSEDALDWEVGTSSVINFGSLTARVSPSGRWLAFMSSRSLTGYDNRDAKSGQPDQEVFLYHAPTVAGEPGTLLCASCNPTGARPLGKTVGEIARTGFGRNLADVQAGGGASGIAANLPGAVQIEAYGGSLYQPRNLSDSGRLFFNSSDALAPADTNSNEDVYQYEPPKGADEAPPGDTCTEAAPTYSPASHGCIDLISSGTSAEESGFLDASENGDDVFFLTASRLSKQDVDTSFDVYDAHLCTAESPCPPPPPPPVPACEGDACQQPATPPNDPTPGSLTFHGAGNLHEEPATCPKGRVRKHGKCVKKHTKKKAHQKRKRAGSNHGRHK